MRPLLLAISLIIGTLGAQRAPKPIWGRVVGVEGKPVDGVAVALLWRAHPELPGLFGRVLADRGLRRLEVLADTDGQFRLRPTVRGPFALQARKGNASALRAFPVMAGSYRNLRLEPDWFVGGRVIDPSGGAVAGARMWLVPYYQTWSRLGLYRLPDRRSTAVTGDDGKFQLRFAHGYLRETFWGDLMALRVAGDGFARTSKSSSTDIVRPTARSKKLEVKLMKAMPLAGVVIDAATRKPIARARVRDEALSHVHGHSTTTDVAGRFNLPIGTGRYLQVFAPGYAPKRIASTASIVLAKGRLLRAQLTDGEKPLAGARVLLVHPMTDAPPLESLVRLDGEGKLDYGGVGDGRTLAGYVEVQGRFRRFLLTVPRGDIDLGIVRVPAGRVQRGRVVSNSGAPVEGARVLLQQVKRLPNFPPRVTYTGRAGRFRFDAVMDERVVLIVGAGTHGKAHRVVKVGDRARIEMPAGKAIAGTIVDGSGKPVAGAWVTLYRTGGLGVREPAAPSAGRTALCVLSDEKGRFRFTGLGSSTWSVICNYCRDRIRYRGSTSAQGGAVKLVIKLVLTEQ